MAAWMRCRLLLSLRFLVPTFLIACLSPLAASSLKDALRPDRMTLDNGMVVWMKSRPGSGSIRLVAAVKVGMRYESPRQRGLAHFVEHMVFEGTARRTHKDLEEDLLAQGGTQRAWTEQEATKIWLSLPPGRLEFGLRWLAETLFRSTFPAERVEIERKILRREEEPQSSGGLWWRLTAAVFGNNSAVEGPQDHKWELRNFAGGLRRADLVRFYKEQYVPNNIVLVAVGDFAAATARAQVARLMGPIARGRKPGRGAVAPLVPRDTAVRVAGLGSYSASSVWCGYAAPAVEEEDYTVLQWVMWLAHYRAAERIREAEGRSYDVGYYPGSSAHWAPGDGDLFCVWADCRYGDIPRVERILREELARVRSGDISQREVAAARASYAQTWREGAHNNDWIASLYAQWALKAGDMPDLDRTLARINAGELRRLARRYLKPQRMFVAYYRPFVTPREIAAALALMVAVLGMLVGMARRRNARIAPPAEHVERVIAPRNTPRFIGARLLNGILYGVPLALIVWGPIWKLADFLFHRAMFGLDFALLLFVCGILPPALIAVGLSAWVRRVAISADGLLLASAGFHYRLSPQRIAAIDVSTISLARSIYDPRMVLFGGDLGQWVIVKTARGFRLCLAVKDAEEFAAQARACLERGAAGAATALS